MTEPSRRSFLGIGLAALLGACSPREARPLRGTPSQDPNNQPTTSAPAPGRNVLLVYFSRAGENYFNGGRRTLEAGNTKVLAGMIAERLACDVYEIEAADAYSASYDETVARNRAEQNGDVRPALARPLPDVSRYDTVLLGSPVWNVRAPMIMSTFIEGVDLSGKTVFPFVTYAVSGMSGIDDEYRSALPGSRIGPGLAVRGEAVADAGQDLDFWLMDVRR